MLLTVKKCIRGGIFHVIHWYAKANNKYMGHNGENGESLYRMYWDID